MADRGQTADVQLTEPETWTASGAAVTVPLSPVSRAGSRSGTLPALGSGAAARSRRSGEEPRSGEQAPASDWASVAKQAPAVPAAAPVAAGPPGKQPPVPGAATAASPLLPKPAAGPLSVSAATAVATKALLGVTLFAQPWAFANAGTAMVPLAVVLITLVTLYTAQMLVTVRQAAVAVLPAPAPGGKQLVLASLPALADVVIGPAGALMAELCVLCACFGILAGYLAFTSNALLPLVPTHHVWVLVWGVSPGAALLCLARGMEHAAVLSLLGNAAAAASSVGLIACFVHLITTGGAANDPVPVVASLEAWDEVDTLGSHGLVGVPVPLAALACSASGFMVHFTLPALEAAMTTPRRAMEAVSRAFLFSAVVLVAFGALGAVGAGASVPRNALDAAGKNILADLLRLLAAVDALTTAPVLVRPALLVLESQWERAMGVKLQTAGAGILRCAFVAAAAAAAAAAPLGRFATLMPMLCGGAAVACTLILPPVMLLVGSDATGEPLVRSGGAERTAAGAIACLGVGALLATGMMFAGAVQSQPFPYNAPPAPPSDAEYDYNNDYSVAEKYAFTRATLNTSNIDLTMGAAALQAQQAQLPRNMSNPYAVDPWAHGGLTALPANATTSARGNGTNATAVGNATAGPFDGWHPGETFNSAAWNPSMYHPPEIPGSEVPAAGAAAAGVAAPGVIVAPLEAGSGAGGASSDN